MKNYILPCVLLLLPSLGSAQTSLSETSEEIQESQITGKGQISPYEIYAGALNKTRRMLLIYRIHFEPLQLSPKDGKLEKTHQSRLRLHIKSLVSKRDTFLEYAKTNQPLSETQMQMLQEIKKLSFPILEEKDINDLSLEELSNCLQQESTTILPLVMQFLVSLPEDKQPKYLKSSIENFKENF